ncbi:four helix bundle protein [Polaribacter sp. Hel_I_88]|uniref:four helix bundle protein n=1 Tax=Polaribacter sp. Hel_I_88 TaxID=1250006 RepID=UPI001E47C967|nr:four helix bundle protein [Polaribacter sp. Hel_I_88]
MKKKELMILSYRDLNVWQNGMDLVEDVYKFTAIFPKEEKYGLTSQVRRCAVSIPSNIAEGFMRQSTKEYIQFLYISLGSLGELDTQMEIAVRLSFMEVQKDFNEKTLLVRKQLFGLIKSLKNKL